METLVMFGIVGLIIGGTIFINRYMIRRRKEAMEVLSRQFDVEFYPEDTGNRLKSTLRGFKIFGRGSLHKASNLMVSKSGSIQRVIFDYTYKTGSGKNRTTHVHTLLLLEYPDAGLPSFTLAREFGFFRKVSNFFGMDDIDFESHKTFSDQYLLKGDNEQWIRELFTEDILDYFTSTPGLTVEGRGRYLVFYQKAGHLKAEASHFRDLMRTGDELAELFFLKTA